MILAIIIAIVWGIFWGAMTNKIIENKGYDENWFWWGFFFGLLAFIVALTKADAPRYTPINAAASLDERTLQNGGWKCPCGRVNPAYTGTCACGRSKREVLAAEKTES